MTANLDCELDDFFKFKLDKGQCILRENSETIITLFNHKYENFDGYIRSLKECFVHNSFCLPFDIDSTNTIWLELFINKSGIKGLGKKMLDTIKLKGIENGFKYIFLYPSSNLSGKNDQEGLISLYERYGFKRLNNCIFTFPDPDNMFTFEKRIRTNLFDNNFPYHLMFSELATLNTTSDIQINVTYKQKYLKYKAKYLSLKKIANL